jgi:hypothetical protein
MFSKSFWTFDLTSKITFWCTFQLIFCQNFSCSVTLPTCPAARFYCFTDHPRAGEVPLGCVCSPVQHQSIFQSVLSQTVQSARGGEFSVRHAILLFLSVLMFPHHSEQISETVTEPQMTEPRKKEPRKTERQKTEPRKTEHRKGPNIERPNLDWDWTLKDRTSNGTERRKTECRKTEPRMGPNIKRLNIEKDWTSKRIYNSVFSTMSQYLNKTYCNDRYTQQWWASYC